MQVQQAVLTTAQTPPCLAKRETRAILLPRTALTRESSDFCWAAIALAADSAILLRVKSQDHILICIYSSTGKYGLAKGCGT